MSLLKLLKFPLKMFKKESISFVIIRRHDLGILNENLTYIAVRPHCNLSTLRFKLWHLLDLPDYSDEVILLKTYDNILISLLELKKGNSNPRKPFILEVWMPGQLEALNSVPKAKNMLAMVENEDKELTNKLYVKEIKQQHGEGDYGANLKEPKRGVTFNKFYTLDSKRTMMDLIESDYENSEISGKMSRSSIFFKVHSRMSRDNFATMIMKIQSDLSTLSLKIGSLESKIKC